jgi:hypothetical protein
MFVTAQMKGSLEVANSLEEPNLMKELHASIKFDGMCPSHLWMWETERLEDS